MLDEQVTSYTVEPGCHVHINAPAAREFDSARPTRLIFYALPNGNTTSQTVGRSKEPGLDWHYDIQHIGAQTRRLRELDTAHNIVTVYLEAEGRSWPSWRRKHADTSGTLILSLIEGVRARFAAWNPTVELTAHSGGGSLLFGFINAVDTIPTTVTRIAFLDANYGWSEGKGHAGKIGAWLRASPHTALVVLAYDDRNIEVDGKKVVGPDGGTWRRTMEMAPRLARDFDLRQTTDGEILRWSGLDGRIDLRAHTNPQNKILHTVLVEKNGFIHAMTTATPFARDGKPDAFWQDRGYTGG